MKRSAAILMLCLAASCLCAAAPKYKLANKFVLGGEGGWDYLTYDPASNRLFIAHNSEVLVVDPDTGKQLGKISTQGAHGTALVEKHNLGFCTNGRAGTVTVFDLKTLEPKGEIKAGQNPDAIIYDPHADRVVVMNGRSKDLMAIDPATQKVVATVPLGGKLEFAAADAKYVYVNVEDTGEIAKVDAQDWKPVARWKLADCEEPSGLAIDEKAGELFTVCGNAKMLVLDAKSGKVISTVKTGEGTDAAGYDPELKLAFASNGVGTLTVVQQGKGGWDLADEVQTQRGARTMAVNPKTHAVYTVTAELGPPAEGERRPSIKPGTFTLLVYKPE